MNKNDLDSMRYQNINNDKNDLSCVEVEDRSPLHSFVNFAGRTTLALIFLMGVSFMAISILEKPKSNVIRLELLGDEMGRTTYSLLTDEQQESLFSDFITTFGRSYAQDAEEYNKRLAVFQANLAIADVRNAAESATSGTGVHGITRFSDLTSVEFSSTYLMQTDTRRNRNRRSLKKELPLRKLAMTSEDPTLIFVDWSASITTEVKNAGSCAGTWATAAVQQIESDAIKAGILSSKKPLSVQQLLSCTPQQDGCTFGAIEDAYEYVEKPGGIYSATDYAYSANEGAVEGCDEPDSADYALTIGGYFSLNTDDVAYNTERLMLAHLTDEDNGGTLSACLDATIWSTYVSGTLSTCDGNEINHCVQIVGMYYSSAQDSGFYKIRGSWGTEWGVDGYISLAYGGDTCAISNNPSYTDPVKDSR